MRSSDKKHGAPFEVTATGRESATSKADAVDLLFTDDRIFATLTAWIEEDLARLEERFAAFHTSDSLSESGPLRRR